MFIGTSFKRNCSFLLLVLSFISGCTTVPEIPPEEQIKTHGLLIGTIHSKNAVGIKLKSSAGKSVLVNTQGAALNGKYISAWLEPGSYEIISIHSFSGLANNNVITVPKGSLPKVKIKVGEVVDLNHLIPYTSGSTQYTVIAVKRTHPFTPPVMQKQPLLFSGAEISSWTVSGPIAQSELIFGSTGQGFIVDMINNNSLSNQLGEADPVLTENSTHEEVFEHIKALSLPTTRITTTADGSAYFGTALGQVRYKQDGSWQYLDTGYIEAITAIDVSESNNITVALESGIILETTDRGKTWYKKYQFKDERFILDLRTIENNLVISTVTPLEGYDGLDMTPYSQFTPKISIYSLREEALNILHEETLAGMYTIGFRLYPPRIENIDSTLFFMISGNTAFRINTQTKQVTHITLPDRFTGMSVNKKKGFLVVWLAQGIFSNSFYSADLGDNWQSLPKPFQPHHVELKSTTEAYMWDKNAGLNSGWFEYNKMDVKNDKWSTLAEAPVTCGEILMNFKLNEHYCVMPNGTLKTFKNNSWN